MNILLIGNGFDLAHGLPTTYKDFLKFVHAFEICKNGEEFDEAELVDLNLNNSVIEYLRNLFETKDEEHNAIISELYEMVYDNFWIAHFNDVVIKETWIDFESEISRSIQCLDALRKLLSSKSIHGEKGVLLNKAETDPIDFLWPKEKISHTSTHFNNEKIRDKSDELLTDLNRLIRALEMYFSGCINTIKVEKKLPDIERLNIDHLLSFNYTGTYERVYASGEEGKKLECDFLHGKARIESTVENSNLVLGIDEYLSEPERSRDNEFIRFKKFFQRIHKKTGCEYKKWIDFINTNPTRTMPKPTKDYLYIFGHSLDVTDGEILRELILTKSVTTTIFYYNKEAYAKQIENLVKILGEDILTSMVYGKNPKISFAEQAAMVSREVSPV